MKTRIVVISIILGILFIFPAFAEEQNDDDFWDKLEEWIDEFEKSPPVKAMKTISKMYSIFMDAYDIFKGIFFPEKSDTEQILEAIEQLRQEVWDIAIEELIDEVDGLLDTYQDYLASYSSTLPGEIAATRNTVKRRLETMIEDKEPRIACRAAKAYNLLIPLLAANRLQLGAHEEDEGEKKDWDMLHKLIFDMFKEAIGVNKVLLGPYAFAELPNIPCYYESDGKIYQYYKSIKGGLSSDDYLDLTEFVWRANEYLREQTIEGYTDTWYTITAASGKICMYTPASEGKNAGARGVFTDEVDDHNNLWRLEFLRFDAARIIHWSRECLTADCLHLDNVHLLPTGETGSEYNCEVFVQENNKDQEYWFSRKNRSWHKGDSFGENVLSVPAVFENHAPGFELNCEVFVREGDHVQHYWRNRKDRHWNKGQSFGENVRSAPAIFQNRNNRRSSSEFNYEVFVREQNHIQHYWYNWKDNQWYKGKNFGKNVQSAPAVIQRRIYHIPHVKYDYDVFVREGSHIQYYWRSNQNDSWYKGKNLGENVWSGPVVFENQGTGSYWNYELFYQQEDKIQHYWYSSENDEWHKGRSFGENVDSAPAGFQNQAPESKYNYEIFFKEGDHIQHYWWSGKYGKWQKGYKFGKNIQSAPIVFQKRNYLSYQIWKFTILLGSVAITYGKNTYLSFYTADSLSKIHLQTARIDLSNI